LDISPGMAVPGLFPEKFDHEMLVKFGA